MRRVSIGIGHADGTDARGRTFSERDVCGDIASLLKLRLEKAGYGAEVIDFPEMSNAEDLAATARAVNAGGFDVHVSLHCDCAPDPAPHGAHVCYLSTAGKKLARAIAKRLCKLMPGRAEQVVKRPKLYILRSTRCVCVLVEFGFLSNEADSAKLAACRMALAEAVFEGLDEYFKALEAA